jgi:rhodanese-related sulfurtransferase
MPIKQITPDAANQLLSQGYTYIDVRTDAEFDAGHPAGAFNIPVGLADPATRQLRLNEAFLSTVEAYFPRDARLVIGCQGGGRSQKAAEILADAGFGDVSNMQGGFGGGRDESGRAIAGWADSGLPVETTAPPDRSYAVLSQKIK